jgi:hypothetical protein
MMLAYALMPVATVPHTEGRISISADSKRAMAKMDPAIGKMPSQSRDTLHRGFVGMWTFPSDRSVSKNTQ